MPQSNFSTVNVEAAAALTCLSSYNEIVGKLNRLWDDQLSQIQGVTDVSLQHTCFQVFPLPPLCTTYLFSLSLFSPPLLVTLQPLLVSCVTV